MSDRLHINRAQLDAFALKLGEADDPHSAAVEGLVQAILRRTLRTADAADLDGAATLVALMEAIARIAIAIPGGNPSRLPNAIGAQVACVIAARIGGQKPGPLDVPMRGRVQ